MDGGRLITIPIRQWGRRYDQHPNFARRMDERVSAELRTLLASPGTVKGGATARAEANVADYLSDVIVRHGARLAAKSRFIVAADGIEAAVARDPAEGVWHALLRISIWDAPDDLPAEGVAYLRDQAPGKPIQMAIEGYRQ